MSSRQKELFSGNFKDLLVWQKAMDFAVAVYGATQAMPKEELHGLTSQFRRAAVNIPARIAEGSARDNREEFIHSLRMAYSSIAELDTVLTISDRLGFLEKATIETLTKDAANIGKLLLELEDKLQKSQSAQVIRLKPELRVLD